MMNYFYLLMLISSVLFFIFFIFMLNDLVYLVDWEIINYNSTSILMIFLLDWMSLLFMSFVLFISSLVVYYSKYYMEGDKNENRFIILIVLFVFSMMMLIISPNIISILLGWDGLGLVSYCLVIYFQNLKSFNAGMLTALTNRIGDVFLLLGVSWMLNFGSWTFYYYLDFSANCLEMYIIGGLVVLASITKSAQIPFSSWLPAAMAAPTPVSALVHSSTLVTAGVYLLIRFSPFLNFTLLFLILLLLGSLTMLMSGLGANYEMDLKKVIALSTLSQLGLMMGGLALGFFKMTFFHLLTHALFKALLFLCAGLLIHGMLNSQDVRWSGGFIEQMPLTLMSFSISNLALCGMPFLAGFYSKDLLLEALLTSQVNGLILFIFFFSTGLTVMYSFRLIFFCVIMNFNGFSFMCLNDQSWGMLKVLLGLVLASIMGGSMLSWLIFPFPYLVILPFKLKILTGGVCLMGGALGYSIFSVYSVLYLKLNNLIISGKMFLSLMWFMPYISTILLNKLILSSGGLYLKSIDFGWNEVLGGGFISKALYNYSLNIMSFHHKNFFKNFLMLFMLLISFILTI